MKRYLLIGFISILTFSCQDRKTRYNSESINLNNEAVKLMSLQKYDSALILLDKATSKDKSYYLAYANKVTIYCELRDFKKALVEVENELIVKPDLAEAWTFAGILHDKNGDTTKANQYYKRSLEIYDNRIQKLTKKEFLTSNKISRAFTLILMGNEKVGKEELRQLKEENPKDLNIENLLNSSKKEIIDNIFESK